MVGGGDIVRLILPQNIQKNAVADGARRRLRAHAPLFGEAGHVLRIAGKRDIFFTAQFFDEFGIGERTFAADAVLDVDRRKRHVPLPRLLFERVQKGDRIAAARQGDADALVFAVFRKIQAHGDLFFGDPRRAKQAIRSI